MPPLNKQQRSKNTDSSVLLSPPPFSPPFSPLLLPRFIPITPDWSRIIRNLVFPRPACPSWTSNPSEAVGVTGCVEESLTQQPLHISAQTRSLSSQPRLKWSLSQSSGSSSPPPAMASQLSFAANPTNPGARQALPLATRAPLIPTDTRSSYQSTNSAPSVINSTSPIRTLCPSLLGLARHPQHRRSHDNMITQ